MRQTLTRQQVSQRAHPSIGCTGLTAQWCPKHGDCVCDRTADMDDPACPLHKFSSHHPSASYPKSDSVPKVAVRHADERWPDTDGEPIAMTDADPYPESEATS